MADNHAKYDDVFDGDLDDDLLFDPDTAFDRDADWVEVERSRVTRFWSRWLTPVCR